MEFNPGTALDYARAVSRPRRVGSGEDEAVAGEIEARLREFGYRVERQAFGFSTGVNVLISLMLVAGMLLVAAAIWLQWLGTRMAIFPALAVLAPAILFDRVLRAAGPGCLVPEPGESPSLWTALCLRLGSRYRSSNLIATRDDGSDPLDRPRLYLVAHYDSKSQHMPLVVRIALSVIAIGGGIAFAVLNVLALPFPGLGPAIIVLGIGVLLATLPLVVIDVGNGSPGAVDNASGIGVVLHLAECLAQRREWLDRLGATILITGAEELAIMGATAYVRRYARALRQQTDAGGLHVLNFDGVGVDGDLFYDPRGRAYPGQLASLVKEAGADLRPALRRFSPMGVLLDHLPFAWHGFDAVTLLAIGRATGSVHTPADSVDKLHVRGFEQAGRVAWRVIEKLAG